MEITVEELPPTITVLLRDRSRSVIWTTESVAGMGLISEVSRAGVLNLAQFSHMAFEVMDLWATGESVGPYLDELSSKTNIPEFLVDTHHLFEATCEPFGEEVRPEIRTWLLGRRGLTEWDLQCAEKMFETGGMEAAMQDWMVDWFVRSYPACCAAGRRLLRQAPCFLAFMFEECATDHMYLVEKRQKLAEEGFVVQS